MKITIFLFSLLVLVAAHNGFLPAQTLNLDYSSYLGGSADEWANAIAVDSADRVYVTGGVWSGDFPTQNPYQAGFAPGGYQSAFISKLSSGGSTLIYSTYLSGGGGDCGNALALDSENQVYVTGSTASTAFSTVNPYQPTYAGDNSDAFISKLSSSGSALLYSTYLGGSTSDSGGGIAVDSAQRAYLTGSASSTDFPTKNPYQAGRGSNASAFVSKLSSCGSYLHYSTYLGGSWHDGGNAICLDAEQQVYVTGQAESRDFPTKNPYQSSFGGGDLWGGDAFVSRLSSSGSSLLYSTYLGGGEDDFGYGICLDSGNRAYVTGVTESSNFPTENPYQASRAGNADVFVSKLICATPPPTMTPTPTSTPTCPCTWPPTPIPTPTPTSTPHGYHTPSPTATPPPFSSLLYSTYLGGAGDDGGKSIKADLENRAYLTGYTSSSDFPTENPYQASRESDFDIFISCLSSSGTSLAHSTYLGGTGKDRGNGIALGSDNRVYVTGQTASGDFPTENPYQADFAGSGLQNKGDAFISSLVFTTPTPEKTPSPSPSPTQTPTPPPTATPSATPAPTSTPTPTPGCSPCAVRAYGNVSDDYSGQPIANARIQFDWVDRCWETHLTLFTTQTGYYDTGSHPAHTVGEGDVEASAWGYHTELFEFSSCGEHSHDFQLESMATPARFVPGDYNGDGTADIAIFRSTSGLWAIRDITRVYFGAGSDLTVPGDYDGDLTADIAIFRGSSGLWAIYNLTRAYFGSSSDLPVIGDYEGGGSTDIGIFRVTTGLWALKDITRIYFGGSTDRPIPADFDGDGCADVTIFRDSSGLWATRNITRFYFGTAGDRAIPAEYDGEMSADAAIFRSTSGLWALRDLSRIYFGSAPDEPVPADFDGNATDDVAIFRDASGLWAARGITRVYYGTIGDIPVTK